MKSLNYYFSATNWLPRNDLNSSFWAVGFVEYIKRNFKEGQMNKEHTDCQAWKTYREHCYSLVSQAGNSMITLNSHLQSPSWILTERKQKQTNHLLSICDKETLSHDWTRCTGQSQAHFFLVPKITKLRSKQMGGGAISVLLYFLLL